MKNVIFDQILKVQLLMIDENYFIPTPLHWDRFEKRLLGI